MPVLFGAPSWLAAEFSLRGWIAYARWSWAHHDTLKYLLAGVVLLSVFYWAVKHNWRLPAIVVSGIGGLFCILAALGIAVLGDFGRKDFGMVKNVEREVRMSHAGELIGVGGSCRLSVQCVLGASCNKIAGESRCWMPCGNGDSCPLGQTCVDASKKKKVCTW